MHIDKPQSFLENVIWTDESKLELFGTSALGQEELETQILSSLDHHGKCMLTSKQNGLTLCPSSTDKVSTGKAVCYA